MFDELGEEEEAPASETQRQLYKSRQPDSQLELARAGGDMASFAHQTGQ